MKEKIAKWYKLGLWTADMVKDAVLKGKLTQEEAAEIIGEVIDENVYSPEAHPAGREAAE